MIDYKYGDLFLKNSIDKQIVIADDAGTVKITNKELYSQKFEITETICSEEHLVFGCCEASVLKFTAANVYASMKGKWINAKMILGGNADVPFSLGRFKVESDKPTADRKKREYVAYDALFDIINTDVAEWYNTILPEKTSTVTMRQFRDSFFKYFGIEQEEITLVNDSMAVAKTIQPEELSGKVVLNAICEINGCFGHIGRNGKFKYIYLEPISEGLYPSETLYPSDNLYPSDPNTARISTGTYISAIYEDYLVEKITKLQIRQEEDDIGVVIGSGENAYVIQDNFLVYGKTSEELNTISQNIFAKIGGIYYRPFTAKAKGNPCLEVGDAISLSTKYMVVHSYILQRTLVGIQALRDEYTAEGTQYQPAEVNGIQKQIIQLKGKTNTLTKEVDETKSQIKDVEKSIRTEIVQTEEDILLEVVRVKEYGDKQLEIAKSEIELDIDSIKLSVEDLRSDTESSLKINSDAISAEVSRAQEAEAQLKVTADEIEASVNDFKVEVEENYYTVTETDSKILASENGILLSVSQNHYTKSESDSTTENLQAQIDINASNIALKVSSDEVQSMIDISLDEIVITSDKIKLEGYTTINGGFSINDDGSALLRGTNAECYMSGNALVISGSNGNTVIGDGDLYTSLIQCDNIDCISLNGYTPITSDSISDYITDYSSDINALYENIAAIHREYATVEDIDNIWNAIDDLRDRMIALESLLSGGSWTYLQLEGYDGDEYAYSYFTK